jgi:DNA-binding MltR family transcriptional regulator
MANNVPDPDLTLEMVEKVRAEMQTMIDHAVSQLPTAAGSWMKEVATFRTYITNETDRGAVLMSAAFLDDKLRELIEKRLVQDRKISRRAFDFNGPLGTFSSRIDLAYLLGIIPKNAQRDLHTIRSIRNQFAHHASPLSYDDEKIKPLCEKLVFHGVKSAAEPDSKFRRSVMGLLSFFTIAFERISPIEAEPDHEITDRVDAYKAASEIFTRITGTEYPLKHHHEADTGS